jgi:hypothetical protein
MTPSRLVAFMIPLMATIPLSGCLIDCDAGRHTRVVGCNPPTVSVQVSTAPALELSGPMRVTYAHSCLGTDEACSLAPQLTLGTDSTGPGTVALEVALTLPIGMSGTFPLPSSTVGVSARLLGSDGTTIPAVTGLRPESGTIVIESSTIAGYVIRFDMELATSAGQRISLTQGLAELSGCHSSYVCSD